MKKGLIILFFTIIGLGSCTDLDEQVYDTIISENFYQTEKQVLSATGPVFKFLREYSSTSGIWGLNSFGTDELILPTRGRHWYNGGLYQRMHKHEWTSEDEIGRLAWSTIYSIVNTTNRLFYQFDQIEEKSDALLAVIEELKGMRAFAYYLGLDLYGNIPLVTDFDVPDDFAPSNNSRQELFDFVEDELNKVIPELKEAVNTSTYGRFHKWVAYTLQAKLYLNAEVYTGTAMWDECIAACDAVINSGFYSLASDYFSNFAINNEGSPENIFVIVYDDGLPGDWGNNSPPRMFQHQYWTLHFNGHRVFNMANGSWNGMCAVPSFVRSYDEEDIRARMWLTGLQYTPNGELLMCNQESAGLPLDYTIDLTSLENSYEYEGARMAKYDYTGAKNYNLSNDFAIFRYADVLLMKAEAIMRKNGGDATTEAVELVNQIRARGFPDDDTKLYDESTLTLDALLAERGWEFAGEGYRRVDMIRFGKYYNTREFKTEVSPDTRSIYPIPQNQLNANPNLNQNPGY